MRSLEVTPRLLTLKQARQYLAGLDPRTLMVAPHTLRPLRFDRARIDAALDGAGTPLLVSAAAANDQENPDERIAQELAELDARLASAAAAPARRTSRR